MHVFLCAQYVYVCLTQNYRYMKPVLYIMFFQGDPMDYVERVSENMQLFAPEDVLTGRDFLYEYDPEVCINKKKWPRSTLSI